MLDSLVAAASPSVAVACGIALAAALPDLGDPATFTIAAVFGSLVGAAYGYVRFGGLSRAQDAAFVGGMLSGAFTLILYLIGLLTGLY